MKYLLLIAFPFCFLFTNDYIITAGVGTVDIIVGKTPVSSVTEILGKDFIVKATLKNVHSLINTGCEYGGPSSTITKFCIRYTYPKKGISVLFTAQVDEYKRPLIYESVSIENIVFEKPSLTSTSDSITINKSDKQDVILKYGNPEESCHMIPYFHSTYNPSIHHLPDTTQIWTYLHYIKKGITFAVDYRTNKVVLIDIYPYNGTPYSFKSD